MIRRCSNYIFIFGLTPGFSRLHEDNCKTRRETFKFWDLVWLILETSRYASYQASIRVLWMQFLACQFIEKSHLTTIYIRMMSHGRRGVSNHRLDYLFNNSLSLTTKKTSEMRMIDPLWGETTKNRPITVCKPPAPRLLAPVAYFTIEVNQGMAWQPLQFNGNLVKLSLIFSAKYATCVCQRQSISWKSIYIPMGDYMLSTKCVS